MTLKYVRIFNTYPRRTLPTLVLAVAESKGEETDSLQHVDMSNPIPRERYSEDTLERSAIGAQLSAGE